MMAVVALSALCALLAGSGQRALAEDDKAPAAPAGGAPSGGTGEAPPSRGSPNVPTANSQPEEDPGDLIPPEDDATASDADARDPYEDEPSEGVAGDDESPELDEPPAVGAQGPDGSVCG